MRRLTQEQYRNIILDTFGPTIMFGGTFDPLPRTDGLLALGARSVEITPAGVEQYYTVARRISAQVVDGNHRTVLVPCRPRAADAADDPCASAFFSKVGRLLYRRPLTRSELQVAVNAAQQVAAGSHDFYKGLAYGLTGMLVSPKFLFVTDLVEPDPENLGAVRLTGYARAARLSFLLWNTGPDDILLTAAENGELMHQPEIERQVARMMQSPKLEAGVRAFFADFLHLHEFTTLEKDTAIYPAFNIQAGEDAREQILRTIVHHVIDRDQDYRTLHTTRQTFLTPRLALIYRVPFPNPPAGWAPYEIPRDDFRTGIIGTIGFLALHSHPGRSSPTLRGLAIREAILCQQVPDPPGDVDFSLFNDPNSPNRTARERLSAHSTEQACAGCHKLTDPIGLALEIFDGAGGARATENGVPIDSSGELDGVPFQNAAELSAALEDNPATPACLVNQLFAYGLGRRLTHDDRDTAAYFRDRFADDGYRVSQLLQRIAVSRAFYKVKAQSGSSHPMGDSS